MRYEEVTIIDPFTGIPFTIEVENKGRRNASFGLLVAGGAGRYGSRLINSLRSQTSSQHRSFCRARKQQGLSSQEAEAIQEYVSSLIEA